ncbi:type II secretion system F family protein [Sphingomonas sp.]|uniref:type II secretion system F family protein n=1 Tax=Sphingomonas sp. TaxID=28214 RepID=UPI002CE3F1EE|nr:type II secretion system F family protein [Sphingomonas sp.]HWK36260.1 type II secretion system F family protein [Sphingomonas sp.]
MPGLAELALLVVAGVLSIGLMTRGALQLAGEHRLTRRLGDLSLGGGEAAPGAAPDGGPRAAVLATLLAGGGDARIEIERHLAAAGYLSANGALTFGVIRLAATLFTGIALYALLLAAGAPAALRRTVPVAAAAAIFLAARFALHMSSARRARKIRAELPFMLDIFVMMVESGASLDQCFRAFAGTEGRAAPLVQIATAQLVEDVRRGMSYDLALGRWADRLAVPGARELATVLRQSLNQGTELAPTLREFAREFAERRIFAARESIGRKTTQMTVVMLVLLMPALMIVLAGPAVSTLGTTIRQLSNTR